MWPNPPGSSYKWALHWMTAALAALLLSTSLPLIALAAIRPAQGQWLYWHVAGGWLIAVLTILRLVRYALVRDYPRNSTKAASAFKLAMLLLLTVDIAAGMVAFRNLPMRSPLWVLGLFEAPVLFRDNHQLHMAAVSSHRWLSYVFTALMIVHASASLRAVSGRIRGIFQRT